jgi:hypothetical protein
MKTKFTSSLPLSGSLYESPQISVVEIALENAAVLCVSQGTIEEWKDGNSFTCDE